MCGHVFCFVLFFYLDDLILRTKLTKNENVFFSKKTNKVINLQKPNGFLSVSKTYCSSLEIGLLFFQLIQIFFNECTSMKMEEK